jgi:hypothetical protein
MMMFPTLFKKRKGRKKCWQEKDVKGERKYREGTLKDTPLLQRRRTGRTEGRRRKDTKEGHLVFPTLILEEEDIFVCDGPGLGCQ